MTTPETLDLILRNFSRDLHVSLPGVVQSFDPATRSVTVVPALTRSVPQGDDLPPVVETLPAIPDVPVKYESGGGYFFTYPLAAGDEGMIVFADFDLGQWYANGGTGVNPGDQRTHSLASAWFVPGVVSMAKGIAGYSQTALRIGKSGAVMIEIDSAGTKVAIGATPSAALAVAMAGLVATQLTALKIAINGAAVLAGDGGATFKANIISALAAWPGNVAATKLFSE
jgi:hypothetical protein